MVVGIIDYGAGNLQSVENALAKVQANAEVFDDPARLGAFDKLILPGVGAFAEGMASLRRRGWVEPLGETARAGVPILGICLGMQLMCLDSDEDGLNDGLGWIQARVRAIPPAPGRKVPHMGWNALEFVRRPPICEGVADLADVYFVHSYAVQSEDPAVAVAETEYGIRFISLFARDNLIGMQFHPEKSQQVGMQMLANFCRASFGHG